MDKFFGADVREPLEFHVSQLLGEDRGRWAQLGDVHLKNTVDSSIRLQVSKKSRYHLSIEWEYCERWKGGGRAWIRWMEFTKTKSGNGRKPHTRPFPPFLSNFPAAACCPDKFNRVLIFVGDAVSKWFPADRRRDALLSTAPSPSSIKIRRRSEPWVSFQSVMSPPTIQRGRSRCRFCTTLVLVAERLTTKFILGCCTWVWCLAEGINLSFSKRYDRNDSELYYGKERRLLSFALDIIGDNF